MKKLMKKLAGKFGYQIARLEKSEPQHQNSHPIEFDADDAAIVDHVLQRDLTMVSGERLYATLMACKHVASNDIPGDFVECGVWRGGNSIIAANVFSRAKSLRNIYLFDTFAGMTAPTAEDFRTRDGRDAMMDYVASQRETHNDWCFASIDDVRKNFADLNLMSASIKFVKGDVVESLKNEDNLPKAISILRLDTDWYESTRAELEVLYPRLSAGGVIIIDDYGHWGGARKAVDEYFRDRPRPLLQYTDYTGRMGVKGGY